MPWGRSRPDARVYLIELLPVLERFRDLQARGAAEARAEVERLQAAAPGPERSAVAEQFEAARETEREELARIASALGAIAPPVAIAAVHVKLVGAAQQSLEALTERAAARRARDKSGLARARQRQAEAIRLWEEAGRELRSWGAST